MRAETRMIHLTAESAFDRACALEVNTVMSDIRIIVGITLYLWNGLHSD